MPDWKFNTLWPNTEKVTKTAHMCWAGGLAGLRINNRTSSPCPLSKDLAGGIMVVSSISEDLMRHVLSALVQNVPGVLSHISGMLASRGYNIDSLAVGETENPHLSRMTFVVVGDDNVLDQVRKQLEKIVTVVRVDDVSASDHVERDLMLIKVSTANGARSEIRELTDIFRGRIVDVAPDMVMIEISGQERKIEAFIEMVRPFGIIELVRTGRIAMVRGKSG
jgi:acetolactate synthase I/III small subunit